MVLTPELEADIIMDMLNDHVNYDPDSPAEIWVRRVGPGVLTFEDSFFGTTKRFLLTLTEVTDE
jgi:hypothetical protein